MRIRNNGDSCTLWRAAFFTGDELEISDDLVPQIQVSIDSGRFSAVEKPKPEDSKPARPRSRGKPKSKPEGGK